MLLWVLSLWMIFLICNLLFFTHGTFSSWILNDITAKTFGQKRFSFLPRRPVMASTEQSVYQEFWGPFLTLPQALCHPFLSPPPPFHLLWEEEMLFFLNLGALYNLFHLVISVNQEIRKLKRAEKCFDFGVSSRCHRLVVSGLVVVFPFSTVPTTAQSLHQRSPWSFSVITSYTHLQGAWAANSNPWAHPSLVLLCPVTSGATPESLLFIILQNLLTCIIQSANS